MAQLFSRDKVGSQRTTWPVRAGIALLPLLLVACDKPVPQDATAEDDPLVALRIQAEAGNAQAQHRLGMIYASGTTNPQDETLALQWMRKSAAQGYPAAQYELGSYFTLDANRDDKLAAHWLSLAAHQGHAPAQFSYGILHLFGRGVLADAGAAHAWLSLAAEQGDGDAINARATLNQRLSPKQLRRARKLYQDYRAQLSGP